MMPRGITGTATQGIAAPSRPPYQSQEEMSEIAKIDTEASLGRVLFKDKLCFVGIKLLSSKRLVGKAGNAFPSKEIQLEVVLMIFNAYAKHSDKNFLGISSCDTLSSPLRQELLFLTDETI